MQVEAAFAITRLCSIGFEAENIGQGRATVTFAAGPQHANPMGTLHGGILCDIADAAMGMAFASTLAPDESFTTIELKINFFRPVWQARLRAEGTVLQRGRTIAYVECTITDRRATGKSFALARSLKSGRKDASWIAVIGRALPLSRALRELWFRGIPQDGGWPNRVGPPFAADGLPSESLRAC